MVGYVDPQRNLYTCGNQYLRFVGGGSFCGFLAQYRPELFRGDDFSSLYTMNNGRTSVPPVILGRALALQGHDRVSDEEAADRARFVIRWKVALGIGIDDAPFVRSTLESFRARLVLHKAEQAVLQRSFDAAKGSGRQASRRLRVAFGYDADLRPGRSGGYVQSGGRRYPAVGAGAGASVRLGTEEWAGARSFPLLWHEHQGRGGDGLG